LFNKSALRNSFTGWIQLKLAEKANLEMASSKPTDLVEEQGNQSGVGAAIERLGRSLKK
jgi:hypothetical protein